MSFNAVTRTTAVLIRSMRMMLMCRCHTLAYSHALSFPQGSPSPLAALKHARMYPDTVGNTIRAMPDYTRYQQRAAHTLAAVHWRDAARQAEPSPPINQKTLRKSAKETIQRDEETPAVAQRSAPTTVGHNPVIDAASARLIVLASASTQSTWNCRTSHKCLSPACLTAAGW